MPEPSASFAHPVLAQWTVGLTLMGALLLFASGRVRHDVVAVLTLLVIVGSGIIPASGAFDGFANPAVMTVAAVLVISRTLQTTGVVALLARGTRPLTETFAGHLAALTGGVTLASGFMNNIGALGLTMPVAIETARERGRAPSLFLMPMAFGSLLGGMVTLIGTPPNIIIASYRREVMGEPFHMFDFTPVGLSVAIAGVIFLTLFARRLLPIREGQEPDHAAFEVGSYFTELKVEAGSELIGKPLRDVPGVAEQAVVIVGLEREGRAYNFARYLTMRAGDALIVQTDPASLAELTEPGRLTLLKGNRPHRIADHEWEDIHHVEVVVPPGSALEGRRMRFVGRRLGRTGYVLGVSRAGARLGPRLRDVTFQAGDVLLVQGEADELPERLADLGLLPLADRDISAVGVERRIQFALLVFALAIAIAAVGWMPASVTFVGAVAVYVLTGLCPARDLYRGVDWPIIVLLGAMFPLGQALETTGLTDIAASAIVDLGAAWPAWAVLTLVLLATMWLTDVINNAATAIVMAPLGLAVAQTLQVSPDPFLIAVAVGASAAFLTPIGHQSNMLVMGPGGYRFTDYWRLGLPLEVVVIAVAVPMILWVWPM